MSIILDPIQREYLNPNLWEMIFVDSSPIGVGIPLINQEIDMKFLVVSTSLPFQKFATETRKTGTKHITEIEYVEEFSMTFNETENLDVYNYFQRWQDQIYDNYRKVFKRGKHTKNATFKIQKYSWISDTRLAQLAPGQLANTFLASSFLYETIKTFEFKNVLFKGFEDLDWDYTSDGNKQITVNFTVDSIEPMLY